MRTEYESQFESWSIVYKQKFPLIFLVLIVVYFYRLKFFKQKILKPIFIVVEHDVDKL